MGPGAAARGPPLHGVRSGSLVRRDPLLQQQGPPDLVETREQHLSPVAVDCEAGAEAAPVLHALRLEIDRQPVVAPRRFTTAEQLGDLLGREKRRHHPVLAAVGGEDVGERRREDRAEAVLPERPHGVLARRATAEVRPGDEDARALRGGPVELELRIWGPVRPEAPVVKQRRSEPGALDAREELLRDDLVGVHVVPRQRRDQSRVPDERLHHGAPPSTCFTTSTSSTSSTSCLTCHSLTSTMRPAIAAAAAIAGLMRWVRPPRPWRPSKLRLDVEAQRSPLFSTSGFIPRHIEQPELRHSNPASRNTRSSRSRSAWAFTRCDPGTTMARTPAATRRPCTTRAAARRSSIRALVQEPRNTRSMGSPASGVPGVSAMYASARSTDRRSPSVGKSAGCGTRPVTSATMPGLVPQVTCGATADASRETWVVYVAPASVRSSRQRATERVHSGPPGARGRSAR